jgi:hypothetical protein
VKKVKNQDSMGKTNFFLSTLPFSPWVASATWLHVGTPLIRVNPGSIFGWGLIFIFGGLVNLFFLN